MTATSNHGRGSAEVARPHQGAVRCDRVAPDCITDVARDVSQVRILPPADLSRTPFHIRALWVAAVALVGAHPFWVRAGMPMPAEILARLTEILNV